MSFFQDLGNFFKDLGGGITANIQGSGDLKSATAAQIQANALITAQTLQFQKEQAERKERLTIIVLLMVFGIPLIGLIAFLALQKT